MILSKVDCYDGQGSGKGDVRCKSIARIGNSKADEAIVDAETLEIVDN